MNQFFHSLNCSLTSVPPLKFGVWLIEGQVVSSGLEGPLHIGMFVDISKYCLIVPCTHA